jgi:hypothetical protein
MRKSKVFSLKLPAKAIFLFLDANLCRLALSHLHDALPQSLWPPYIADAHLDLVPTLDFTVVKEVRPVRYLHHMAHLRPLVALAKTEDFLLNDLVRRDIFDLSHLLLL